MDLLSKTKHTHIKHSETLRNRPQLCCEEREIPTDKTQRKTAIKYSLKAIGSKTAVPGCA